MNISIVTNVTKWCTQSDWPVHPLILVRQFAVCMVICCPVMEAQWLSGRVLDSRPRGRITALCSLSKTHLS